MVVVLGRAPCLIADDEHLDEPDLDGLETRQDTGLERVLDCTSSVLDELRGAALIDLTREAPDGSCGEAQELVDDREHDPQKPDRPLDEPEHGPESPTNAQITDLEAEPHDLCDPLVDWLFFGCPTVPGAHQLLQLIEEDLDGDTQETQVHQVREDHIHACGPVEPHEAVAESGTARDPLGTHQKDQRKADRGADGKDDLWPGLAEQDSPNDFGR